MTLALRAGCHSGSRRDQHTDEVDVERRSHRPPALDPAPSPRRRPRQPVSRGRHRRMGGGDKSGRRRDRNRAFAVDSRVKKVQHPTGGVVPAPLDDRRQFPSHPTSRHRPVRIAPRHSLVTLDDVEDAEAEAKIRRCIRLGWGCSIHIELFALRRIRKFSRYLSRLDRATHSRDTEARPAITSALGRRRVLATESAPGEGSVRCADRLASAQTAARRYQRLTCPMFHDRWRLPCAH